jgi:hypothetical protein
MYHSISVWNSNQKTDTSGHNSWASWRLIPSSRPHVVPPTKKTYYEDIPYTNGKIDLSTMGLDDAVFENRSGVWSFIIMNDMIYGYDDTKKRMDYGNAFSRDIMTDGKADMWDWDKTYSTVLNTIHGKVQKVVLEDDPSFYYSGNIEVESLESEESYTSINIKYDFYPFKIQRFSTVEDWVWDAIDFEANPDILGIKNIVLQKNESAHFDVYTLRKRIVPKITTNGYLRIRIYDNYSTSARDIYLRSGVNNFYYPEGHKDYATYSKLYFNGMSNTTILVINESNNKPVTFSIDYRLEGF